MHTLTTQLASFAAIGAFGLGNAWINEGYGLHPMIAFPLATLLVIAPYVFRKL